MVKIFKFHVKARGFMIPKIGNFIRSLSSSPFKGLFSIATESTKKAAKVFKEFLDTCFFCCMMFSSKKNASLDANYKMENFSAPLVANTENQTPLALKPMKIEDLLDESELFTEVDYYPMGNLVTESGKVIPFIEG